MPFHDAIIVVDFEFQMLVDDVRGLFGSIKWGGHEIVNLQGR